MKNLFRDSVGRYYFGTFVIKTMTNSPTRFYIQILVLLALSCVYLTGIFQSPVENRNKFLKELDPPHFQIQLSPRRSTTSLFNEKGVESNMREPGWNLIITIVLFYCCHVAFFSSIKKLRNRSNDMRHIETFQRLSLLIFELRHFNRPTWVDLKYFSHYHYIKLDGQLEYASGTLS